MKIAQHTYDLIIANLLFGVSYSVVVTLLERDYTADQIFTSQIAGGALIYLPYLDLRRLAKHLPHILRNTTILLLGWQRLTLLGSHDTPPLTIAAIAIPGVAITLIAARNIHALRLFCVPLIVAILSLPQCNVGSEWLIFCGIVCVAISTILAREMVRELGATRLLAGYFTTALLILPLLPHHTPSLILGDEPLLLLFQTTLGSALPLYLLLRGSSRTTPLATALSRYLQSAVGAAVFYIPKLSCILT